MYKVLIVEDDENMCFLYSKMKEWKDYGFRIAGTAFNGREAMEKLKNFQYDVVATDIRMPDMDGITLLKEIREHKIPVLTVLISSYDEFEYARQGILYGACDFLVKPIRRKNLAEMLQRLKDLLEIQSKEEINSDFMKVVCEKLELDKKDDFSVRVCRICVENLEENITMEQLSEQMNLSKDYFGKMVKQHFGVPFKEVMNIIKIEYAKKMIQEENLKTYEISQLLGYSSPDYFTKIFKQYAGITPSQFKKEK